MKNPVLAEYKNPRETEKYTGNYYVYLVGDKDPIIVNRKERETIVFFMEQGKKFVVVGEYVLMIASIKLILPQKETVEIIKPIKKIPEYKLITMPDGRMVYQEVEANEKI